MRSIPERDWKQFKQVHSLALDRFCRRVLAEVSRILADESKEPHDRYLAMYKLTRERDKELAQVFNDFRRSTAFWQIAGMYTRGLLTEEEFSHFSDETRNTILELSRIANS